MIRPTERELLDLYHTRSAELIATAERERQLSALRRQRRQRRRPSRLWSWATAAVRRYT
jgi:hypothetical protein